MGCCAKAEDERDGPKRLNDRRCTDVACCLLFAVFWAGLVVIFILSTMTGDPISLLYDADYLGNRCGTGAMESKKKAYYPRMGDDLYEQKAYLIAGAVWNIKLYTICVEECPSSFDISSPKVITDYGYDPESATTQQLGSRTQAQWISILPTYDVLNRCIPYSESDGSETDLCAYPSCNATEVLDTGAECAPDEGPGYWTMSTDVQKSTCLVKVTKVSGEVFAIQTASDDVADASETLLKYIANAAGFLNDVVSSLQQTAPYLAGFGILLPIVLSFAYALFLRFFAKVAIYSMILLLIIAMILLTCVCYAKAGLALGGVSAASVLAEITNASAEVGVATAVITQDATLTAMVAVQTGDETLYEIAFWVMAILTAIVLVLVFLWRKRLRMTIAIVQEACAVFRTMPSLMLFPFTTVFAVVLVCVWSLFGAFLIVTSKPEAFADKLSELNATLISFGETAVSEAEEVASGAAADAVDSAATLSSDAVAALSTTDGETLVYFLAGYWLFGFLWTIQFLEACAWTTMSGAVVYWYFFRRDDEERTRIPILKSGYRVLRFHLGSMAFGALIIAICQFVRILMEYLDQQTKDMQEANFVLKLALKSIKCCLWCFEKTIRFITGYGFVYVALQGSTFCYACFETFKFVLGNLIQVGINTVVSKLLTTLAVVGIPICCCAGAFAYFDNVLAIRNPMYPTAFVLVVSAVVSNSCASVFECTITTIFVCCFRDSDSFGGKHMSEELRKAFGMPKPGADDAKGEGKGKKKKKKKKKEVTTDDGYGDDTTA